MPAFTYIEPSDIWGFFLLNKERLESEEAIIADSDENDYAICLSSTNGRAVFTVYDGDRELENYYPNNSASCEKAANEAISACFPKKTKPGLSEKQQEAIVEEREFELMRSFGDFLMTVLNDHEHEDGWEFVKKLGVKETHGLLDEVLALVSDRYDFPVYRPRLVFDEEIGSGVFVEFPYDEGWRF